MSKSIVLYADGSTDHNEKTPGRFTLGWGVVALFNDQTVELHGTYHVDCSIKSDFEFIAFFEAVLYARSHGYAFEEMSIYTDDMSLAYADFRLRPENFSGTVVRDTLLDRLERLAKKLYSPQALEEVLECLKRSRITKLKGHKLCVYHNRVDYLAHVGAELRQDEGLLPFDAWLKAGFFNGRNGHRNRWYPPFTNTLQ